jgi:hypothetical protein
MSVQDESSHFDKFPSFILPSPCSSSLATTPYSPLSDQSISLQQSALATLQPSAHLVPSIKPVPDAFALLPPLVSFATPPRTVAKLSNLKVQKRLAASVSKVGQRKSMYTSSSSLRLRVIRVLRSLELIPVPSCLLLSCAIVWLDPTEAAEISSANSRKGVAKLIKDGHMYVSLLSLQ